MRHKGSDSEFKLVRDNEILGLYRRYIESADQISLAAMLQSIVNSPSSRFWITEQRAAIVLSSMLRGETFKNAYPEKRKMYRELFRRAQLIWKESPDMSVFAVASIVVEQPAPSFYMSTQLCNLILTRARQRAWQEAKRKKQYT